MHKDTFRQIAIDVPRMSPLVGLFQQRLVQEMVERILYIWAIRCFILSLNTSGIEIDTLTLILILKNVSFHIADIVNMVAILVY